MLWTPAILAKAAGGTLLFGDPGAPIGKISTDTRTIEPGQVFIALPGECHDGHIFVADAIGKGAGAVIVSRWGEGAPDNGCAVIRSPDTLDALGGIARFHRLRCKVPVIAVTGSNGKTSTKEMIASIFAARRKVLKSWGNFNNLIGLPLTLLELNEGYDVAVVEMGINVPGEMERLSRIGSPDAAVITNIHPAHLQGLDSVERIVEEKGLLWKSLRPGGLAVVNLDDPMLVKYCARIPARIITWSLSDPAAAVRARGPVAISPGRTFLFISYNGIEVPVSLRAMGIHNARNALAATAAAVGMGASLEEVASGLAAFEQVKQRMFYTPLPNGRILIDDTYNANPRSMIAAAETVHAACDGKPFVAVLGEMRELGPASAALHFRVGEEIGALKPGRLITLGQMAAEIRKGAIAAGMSPRLCFHAQTHKEAVDHLLRDLPEGSWVLVKGSRGMTMERIVEGISPREWN